MNLKLENRHCVVVGGGRIAFRKAISLLECRARITMLSPEINDSFNNYVKTGRIRWKQKTYNTADIKDAFLVIAATSESEVNRKISNDCREKSILVNVVDSPDLSDFFVPSVLRRGDLTIAIGTGGAYPSLAAHIKKELENVYGPEYSIKLDILRDQRKKLPGIDLNKSLYELTEEIFKTRTNVKRDEKGG